MVRFRWKGMQKITTYALWAAKPSYDTRCLVLAPPAWVGKAVQRCPFQHKQGMLLPWISAQSPSTWVCGHGLRWFKPAAQSELVLWASTQPAPVCQSVVRVQIETKVPLQGKQILNVVGRGRQPPIKLLFKCQNPNQGRNAVSADDKLPRRTGSVSIQAGSEDLC